MIDFTSPIGNKRLRKHFNREVIRESEIFPGDTLNVPEVGEATYMSYVIDPVSRRIGVTYVPKEGQASRDRGDSKEFPDKVTICGIDFHIEYSRGEQPEVRKGYYYRDSWSSYTSNYWH